MNLCRIRSLIDIAKAINQSYEHHCLTADGSKINGSRFKNLVLFELKTSFFNHFRPYVLYNRCIESSFDQISFGIIQK